MATEAEKDMLDMLNGLALASEVGLRRFESPPVSSSVLVDSRTHLRDWLYQGYIENDRHAPSNWISEIDLWKHLNKKKSNSREKFIPLANEACDKLKEEEKRNGTELDHYLAYFILGKKLPSDSELEPKDK